jgi:cytochrome c556
MRIWLSLGAAAALVTVAACNRSGEGESRVDENRAEAAEKVANGSAGATDVATLMHDRHERYEEIGKAFKGIGRELKADSPSVETIRRHSALINLYAPQIPSWFPTGSGPETGRRTRAKAEIWTDNETFRRRAEAFRVEAARFDQIAASGDVAAIRAAQPRLAEACKNCHDRFRGPEQDHDHE